MIFKKINIFLNPLFGTFIVNGLRDDAKRKTIFNYLKQKKFRLYC